MADGISHGDDREPEGERYTQKADTDLRKGGRQHGTAATAEGEPECANEFGNIFARVHERVLDLKWWRCDAAMTGIGSADREYEPVRRIPTIGVRGSCTVSYPALRQG